MRPPGLTIDNWSFGGGTVLMLKYRHRISQDIDIFVDDPQWLGFFNPDLGDTADTLATGGAIVDRRFVKLYCDEGEIDFVAAGPVAPEPTRAEAILGRRLRVETCAEIVGKKLFYRARLYGAGHLRSRRCKWPRPRWMR